MAWIDGEPITLSEVAYFLEPAPPRVGGTLPLDPRQVALRRALRVRLFAAEGARRGLAPPASDPELRRALLHRGLIELATDETQQRQRAAALDERTGPLLMAAHHHRLAKLRSARISAVVLDSAAHAEELLGLAAGLDEDGFRELVAERSLDAASRDRGGELAVVDRRGEPLDVALARVAVQLRSEGAVGLAEQDGRWYVLRASEVELEPLAWNDEMALRLAQLLAYEQRQQTLDELEARLRDQAKVHVDLAVLAQLPVPSY